MSELQIIQTTLERTARRRRLQRAWRGFWHGLFAGAALWLTVLGFYKIAPLPAQSLEITALIAAACMLAGFVVGWWRKPTLVETARWVDQKKHFQERLSTALEVANQEKAGRWRELLLSDAAGHARDFDFRKSLPFHLPMIARWSVLILVR